MNTTLTIDAKPLLAACDQLIARSRHSAAYVINKKMFYVAKRAYESTPVASRTRIQETFNVTQRERTVKRGKHAGKIRRVTNYQGLNASAFAINAWQRQRDKLPPSTKEERLKHVKKMVAGRLRAIGSLKSGWIGAIVKLQRQLLEMFSPTIKTGILRENAGDAMPAREGPDPTAQVAYRIASRKAGKQPEIDKRVVAALQNAFNAEADDTLRFLASELQKEANKVNAK